MRAARALGFSAEPFATAEQVRDHLVTRVDKPSANPAPGADGLITANPGLTLAIYVADCAAVYLVDTKRRRHRAGTFGQEGDGAEYPGRSHRRVAAGVWH